MFESPGWCKLQAAPASYFLLMLVKPAQAIERILAEQPAFWSLVIFLAIVGLLRGILDGALALLFDGQFFGLWQAGRLPAWFIFKAYPLLLVDWLAVYVRWLGFAMVAHLLARLCGGTGRVMDMLRLYGVILGIYVVTALPNFAYLFVPLPMAQFYAAPQFNPTLGVGQFITSAWLAWVTYLLVRRLHGLPAFESAAIGTLTPVFNVAALVLPGAIIFNLPQARAWGETQATHIIAFGLSAVSVILITGMIVLTRWLRHVEATNSQAA